MRITREKLIELARRHAVDAARETALVSAYLTGSVVSGDPLLGGYADVDLVLIHETAPPRAREVVPLSDDVHLDVAHHARSRYTNPRALRVDPWLGPAVCEPAFLYDPDHFFEWAQAGARGQFHRPDHVAARARAMLEAARAIAPASASKGGDWLAGYLEGAMRGANAAALLTGFPVWGRRFCLSLDERAHSLGHPEVHGGFVRLMAGENDIAWDLPAWISAWARAIDLASASDHDPDLHPSRRAYYLRGFQALLEAGHPESTLWHLLVTWLRAIRALRDAGTESDHVPAFQSAREALGLQDVDRTARAGDLESYLDHAESLIEDWAVRAGA
ncbi:MAG: hypothetical protein ACRDG5_11765 [Anaerolineales bacterium]